jgi:predicted Zn-dependent protease
MEAQRAGEEVVSAITRTREAEGADRQRARHDLLSRYPWLGLAHRFEAELYHAEGDLDAAVAAMVAALVLTPEDPSFWQILAFLLKARDHERAALLANAIGGMVHRAGSGLHSL